MKEEGFGQARGILLAKSDGCSVYQFRNETGDGTMTCYEVFPGAMLSFNDFHVKYFDSEYVPGRNMFVIDHCREGKMEYLAGKMPTPMSEPGTLRWTAGSRIPGVLYSRRAIITG